MKSRWQRVVRPFWFGLGILSVGLGTLGMLLPVLPTTPFLLLAAFCFARSSPRFLTWLENNRFFGSYLRRYRRGLGMAARDKAVTITLLWISIGLAAFWGIQSWPLRLVLLAIAGGVTFHLLRIPTCRVDDAAQHDWQTD